MHWMLINDLLQFSGHTQSSLFNCLVVHFFVQYVFGISGGSYFQAFCPNLKELSHSSSNVVDSI